jgi:hypothetical protein
VIGLSKTNTKKKNNLVMNPFCLLLFVCVYYVHHDGIEYHTRGNVHRKVKGIEFYSQGSDLTTSRRDKQQADEIQIIHKNLFK